MKRPIIVITWILAQVLIIIFLAWQFQIAPETGTDITLSTKPEVDDMYTYELTDDYYAQFEINFIMDDQLVEEATWNDVIYVQLKKGEDDSYVVNSAHIKKPTPTEGEIILQGMYMYEDKETQTHYIEYGFEQISNIDSYGNFSNTDHLEVSFRYAGKWNQFKVLDVKKAE